MDITTYTAQDVAHALDKNGIAAPSIATILVTLGVSRDDLCDLGYGEDENEDENN